MSQRVFAASARAFDVFEKLMLLAVLSAVTLFVAKVTMLDATTKQLMADLDRGKISQDTYNRAVAGAQLDSAIAQQPALNSALGASALRQSRAARTGR